MAPLPPWKRKKVGICTRSNEFHLDSSLSVAGPLGNPTGPSSAGASRGNSNAGSRENLCEECIQNPLDLIDASIQVGSNEFIY